MADNMDFNSTTVFGEVKVLMLKGEKGDTGEDGTSGNYSQLTNKPSINGVTLTGNMTSDALGVASVSLIDSVTEDLSDLSDNVYTKSEVYTKTESDAKYLILNNIKVKSMEIVNPSPSISAGGGWYPNGSLGLPSGSVVLGVLSCRAIGTCVISGFVLSNTNYEVYVTNPSSSAKECNAVLLEVKYI